MYTFSSHFILAVSIVFSYLSNIIHNIIHNISIYCKQNRAYLFTIAKAVVCILVICMQLIITIAHYNQCFHNSLISTLITIYASFGIVSVCEDYNYNSIEYSSQLGIINPSKNLQFEYSGTQKTSVSNYIPIEERTLIVKLFGTSNNTNYLTDFLLSNAHDRTVPEVNQIILKNYRGTLSSEFNK